MHDEDSDNGPDTGHMLPYENFSSDEEPDPQEAFKGVALSMHGNSKFSKKKAAQLEVADTRYFNAIMKIGPREFNELEYQHNVQYNRIKNVIKENKNSNSDFLNN